MGLGSFFKGLGKGLLKIAPIATMFIPGLGPVASAALSGAAGAGAGAVSGGKKGALIGGLMGAAGGAAKGAASAAGKGASTVNAGTKGSLISSLLSPQGLGAIGSGISAITKSQASNRGAELEAMMAADEMRMRQAQDRRTDESDLIRKIQAMNYIKNGGASNKPKFSSSGIQIPSFSSPPPVTEGDKQMAETLLPQLMGRLNTVPNLRNYDSKMKPGTTENVLSWLGPMLGAYGTLKSGVQNGVKPPVEPTPPTGGTASPGNPFLPPIKKPIPEPIW